MIIVGLQNKFENMKKIFFLLLLIYSFKTFSLELTISQGTIKPTPIATILIGPEGGLSGQEMELANRAGFQSVLLGKRVLRTETASLVAIANMQLLWGS